MSFLVVLLSVLASLFSQVSFAQHPPTRPEGTGLRIVIYTAPSWCHWCRELERFLAERNWTRGIPVEQNGRTTRIPVQSIDVDSAEPSALAGRTSTGVPEIQIWRGSERVYASGGALLSVARWSQVLSPLLPASVAFASAGPSRRATARTFPGHDLMPASAALLIGTGSGFEDNPIFVGNSLVSVRGTLETYFGLPPQGVLALYGNGTEDLGSAEGEALQLQEILPHRYARTRQHIEGVHPVASFTPGNLTRAVENLRSTEVQKLLVVISGHGSETGIATWLPENSTVVTSNVLTPERLAQTLSGAPQAQKVIVSGACYGGRFASAGSCGFFAAHPDYTAAGCSPYAADQRSQNRPQDYVANFFLAAGSLEADVNSDGQVSFSEAHANAMLTTSPGDIPYTTMDALADQHFTDHPNDLPPFLARTALDDLVRAVANPEETSVYRSFQTFLRFRNASGAWEDLPGIFLKTISISARRDESDQAFEILPLGVPETRAERENRNGHLHHAFVRHLAGASFDLDTLSDLRSYHRILSPREVESLAALQGTPEQSWFPRPVVVLAKRLIFKRLASRGALSTETYGRFRDVTNCEQQSVEGFLSADRSQHADRNERPLARPARR